MRPAEIKWVLRALTDALAVEIKDRDCRNAARSEEDVCVAAGGQEKPGKAYNGFALDPLEGSALLMLWFRYLTSNPTLLKLVFQMADL